MRAADGPKAWAGVFDFPLPGRIQKPRNVGLTMVIDKGLGLAETKDLMDLAADYVDILKLTFGTSAFYDADLLKAKIKLVKSYGVDVFPGGTFLEIAILQGKVDTYLERAVELGFCGVEVSDGTISMSRKTRNEVIRKAQRAGLKVVSEVGKKDSRDGVAICDLKEQVAQDIEAGVMKVIVEGRESGRGVGIYDHSGAIIQEALDEMAESENLVDMLLWEAPLKNQQSDLILRFGPNVNLGNILPSDVLALEALRVGLRGDTLRACVHGMLGTQSSINGFHNAATGEDIPNPNR